MKKKSCILFFIFSFFLSGCNDNYVSSIPDYPVNLKLNLTTTYPTFKNSYNQYLLFEKRVLETDRIGYGGIMVYTGFDGTYYAWDMACPYEADKDIKVHPNELGQAICDSCKSVFELGFGVGNPSSGPAKEVLKKYKTSLSGDVLYVFR
jgi:hypothetical protein